MYLISPLKKQYKANLHAHSTLSDGKKTPDELKKIYKDNGYSVLAITDHEHPFDHSRLTDEDFIALTGYEAYIRPHPKNKFDPYNPEVHINLFARDPHNTAIVCYSHDASKYLSLKEKIALRRVGPDKPREYSVEYVNGFLKAACENGYIASFNHYWWSMGSEADALCYDGFFSMEMCNYRSYAASLLEYNASLYDKLLSKGKRIFCHSADDNHNDSPESSPLYDSFGAFTMVIPEEFSYDALFNAMERGDMYSSMGPVFKEVSVEGNRLHVECSDVARITLFTGSKSPTTVFPEGSDTVNSADFELDGKIKFVRVSITDVKGHHADTRGYFKDEIGL